MITLEYVGDVGLIMLDTPEHKVNTLDIQALRDMRKAFDDIQQEAACQAVVIASAKSSNFLAGVDISLFTSLSAEELRRVTTEGQEFYNRIANFPKPVVAAVHGACAGGGTELVLACHYRIASDDPATHFALPEVQLGLLPGLGGTQRMPALVGLQKGLELVLTGRKVHARQARRIGLVDALHHREGLLSAALEAAAGLATGQVKPATRRRSGGNWLLERTPASGLIYRQAAARAEKQGRGNYPAPGRIIEAVRIGREQGLAAGLRAEADAFSELAASSQARGLMHVFFARSGTRHNPFKGQEQQVQQVAVLGAGLMGGGIAQVSASAGMQVLLIEQELGLAAAGRGRISRELGKRIGRGLTAFGRDRLVETIRLSERLQDAGQADLTIEAVPEKLELKQAVLAQVEAVAGPDHVFASNTSSIPIGRIAATAARPGQVVGMHYFSPVPRMPLLEVVRSEFSSEAAVATAVQVGLRQGKSVIVVGDTPGFYVNRILAPYINEALLLLQEGVRIERIDLAMRDAGFPVGPFKLLDEVGLDVADSVQAVMAPFFAERGQTLASSRAVLEAGLLGRKGGKGFYVYGKSGSGTVNNQVYRLLGAAAAKDLEAQQIRSRLLYALCNEAAKTLEEGVISSALDGDAGAVFGFGFPPFLGGPFWHLDQTGIQLAVTELDSLRDSHGARFEAAPLLRRMAASGESFYGSSQSREQAPE